MPWLSEPSRSNGPSEVMDMLYWALVFFVVSIVAALFGFGNIAAGSADIARILFFVFIVLFVISLIMGLVRRGPRV